LPISFQSDSFIFVSDTDLDQKPTKCSRFRSLEYLYFAKNRVLYKDAEYGCKIWSASLVKIPDNETQQHLVYHLPLDQDCDRTFYYIGLFLRDDSQWFWPDNSSLKFTGYTNWRINDTTDSSSCHNEPNGYRGCNVQPNLANATQISGCNSSRVPLGTWFDKNQETSRWYYICQRPAYNISTSKYI